MWDWLSLFEADVGMLAKRLFEADVGMLAPISEICGDSLRLFETDVELIAPI